MHQIISNFRSSTTSRLLGRGARAAGWRLSRLGDRLGRETHSEVTGAGAHGDRHTKYGSLWAPADEAAARNQIVTYEDNERFEATGKQEVEARVAPFVDKDSVVLDLGCGIGRIALYVAPLVKTLWVADASRTMLDMAQERLAGLENVRTARCLDTTVPSVPDGSVDFVYSVIVLQHMEKEDAFLLMRDVVRMLVPGGRAAMTFPNILDPAYLEAFIDCALGGRPFIDNAARPQFWTVAEVDVIARAAGFSSVEVWDGPDMTAVCVK